MGGKSGFKLQDQVKPALRYTFFSCVQELLIRFDIQTNESGMSTYLSVVPRFLNYQKKEFFFFIQ